MAESNRSHTQQTPDAWTNAFGDHVGRIEAFYAGVDGFQAKAMEQARTNLDEMNRLTKESFAYAAQLAGAWRKLTIDATRRATETAFVSAVTASRG